MILNKMIMHKPTVEDAINETIAVIYQLDGMERIPIRCDYNTKIYTLDRSQQYIVIGSKHFFKIENGQLFMIKCFN